MHKKGVDDHVAKIIRVNKIKCNQIMIGFPSWRECQ